VRRIFARIPELRRPGVKNIEDYILFVLMGAKDVRVNKEVVLAMFWTLFGKPAQNVQLSTAEGKPLELVVRNIGNFSKPV